MICQSLTEKDVKGLPLSIMKGKIFYKRLNVPQKEFPWNISNKLKWFPLQKLNSVPRHVLSIKTTLPQRPHVLTSALLSILVVKITRMAEMFKPGIDKMIEGTNLKLITLLNVKHANLTHKDLLTDIHKV